MRSMLTANEIVLDMSSLVLMSFFIVFRKVVGKVGSDAAPSPRVKREADSDGGEEVVFGKKARHDTTTNDLK